MTEIDSLQQALAAEHAAVYLYGVLVARLPDDAAEVTADALAAAYDEHRDRRDQLTARLRSVGATPEAAAPGYDLPEPLGTIGTVLGAARAAEAAAAQTYAALVAASAAETRQWAISALSASAVRATTLGAPAEPFPGAPELG